MLDDTNRDQIRTEVIRALYDAFCDNNPPPGFMDSLLAFLGLFLAVVVLVLILFLPGFIYNLVVGNDLLAGL